MDRRSFLKVVPASVATAAAVTRRAEASPKEQAPPPPPLPRETVHVLREPRATSLSWQFDQFIEGLARDVFARVAAAMPPVRVSDFDRLGCVDYGLTLTEQWNTGAKVDRAYLSEYPPLFDLESFRARTDNWSRGMALNLHAATPAREAFGRAVIVGTLPLPQGVEWAGNLVDERTGAMMRAIAVYEITVDEVVVRFDVLCGSR